MITDEQIIDAYCLAADKEGSDNPFTGDERACYIKGFSAGAKWALEEQGHIFNHLKSNKRDRIKESPTT